MCHISCVMCPVSSRHTGSTLVARHTEIKKRRECGYRGNWRQYKEDNEGRGKNRLKKIALIQFLKGMKSRDSVKKKEVRVWIEQGDCGKR